MNYAGALELLAQRQEARWKLGLTRIEGLLAALGNPHDSLKAVHVAGTNGKGSFCALLASSLQAAGLRVGLFTSPHLISPRERIQVDGKMISETDFAAAISAAAEAEAEPATYFELVTAAAFLHFKNTVDVAVVEVGMGGRLDATNALKRPLLSVVTSIGFDHTQWLGETLGAIAGEKAGILKQGSPFLCAEDGSEALAVLRARAYEAGAPMVLARPEFLTTAEDWQAGRQRAHLAGLGEAEIGLLGAPAARAAALAVRARDLLQDEGLDISDSALREGFSKVHWPGRFQVASDSGRIIVLDGAHNSPAFAAFTETWKRSPFSKQAPTLLYGVLADKDHAEMARMAAGLKCPILACRPESPRALDAEAIAEELRLAGADARPVSSPESALEAWRSVGKGPLAVCGSFYLVGRVLRALQPVAA